MEKLLTPDIYVALALIQSVVFLLLIRFLDLYEREPLSVLAIMAAWGAIGAGILSTVGNKAVAGLLSPEVRAALGSAISGPLVEETAKGLALVAAFVHSHWAFERFGWLEFEGVTDGIVYGAAVGLGFAFTEDLLYLFEEGLKEYRDRIDLFSVGQLGHAVYTGTFGAGLGLATWSRGWIARLGLPTIGLGIAMLMHAAHNGLVNLVLVLRYGVETTAAWKGFDFGYVPSVCVSRQLAERMQATEDAAAVVGRRGDEGAAQPILDGRPRPLWHLKPVELGSPPGGLEPSGERSEGESWRDGRCSGPSLASGSGISSPV